MTDDDRIRVLIGEHEKECQKQMNVRFDKVDKKLDGLTSACNDIKVGMGNISVRLENGVKRFGEQDRRIHDLETDRKSIIGWLLKSIGWFILGGILTALGMKHLG